MKFYLDASAYKVEKYSMPVLAIFFSVIFSIIFFMETQWSITTFIAMLFLLCSPVLFLWRYRNANRLHHIALQQPPVPWIELNEEGIHLLYREELIPWNTIRKIISLKTRRSGYIIRIYRHAMDAITIDYALLPSSLQVAALMHEYLKKYLQTQPNRPQRSFFQRIGDALNDALHQRHLPKQR